MFFLERETCYTYILSVFCLLKEEFQIIGKFLMAGPMNFPLLPFFLICKLSDMWRKDRDVKCDSQSHSSVNTFGIYLSKAR